MSPGITFPVSQRRGLLSLQELLVLIGTERVAASIWSAHDIEAAGAPRGARELMRLGDSGEQFNGDALIALAEEGVQIIDGELRASAPTGGELRIRAVDSTHWDVEAVDEELLRAISLRVDGATALPDARS